MHIAVVGAGIVGVCTAAWLQRDGHTVTFVDPLDAGEGCSFGNAGSLSPSACLPVGMPGIWRNAPKWLMDPDGPLTIRARYLPVVLPWLLQFLRHSTRKEVARIAQAMRDLLGPVFECYEPLLQRANASHLVRRTGCLYVYSSRQAARQWNWGMDLRRGLGVELKDVNGKDLAELEPDLKGRFEFGHFAPENGSTVDPSALVKAIHAQAIKDGAHHVRAEATGFEARGGVINAVLLGDGEALPVDGVVVAAGAWSARLARQLGNRIPLESQRGYHVTVHNPNIHLNRTLMVVESNIMVNPMAMGLRLAGTVEFAGLSAPPRAARGLALLKKGKVLFPDLNSDSETYWMGHRPCLPDSMPIIGRASAMENAWLGFGHGHVGMCGGATTGREIANLVSGREAEVDLHPFRPDRFMKGAH